MRVSEDKEIVLIGTPSNEYVYSSRGVARQIRGELGWSLVWGKTIAAA